MFERLRLYLCTRDLRNIHQKELQSSLVQGLFVPKWYRYIVYERQFYEMKLEKLLLKNASVEKIEDCIYCLKCALDKESSYMCESWMKHVMRRLQQKTLFFFTKRTILRKCRQQPRGRTSQTICFCCMTRTFSCRYQTSSTY